MTNATNTSLVERMERDLTLLTEKIADLGRKIDKKNEGISKLEQRLVATAEVVRQYDQKVKEADDNVTPLNDRLEAARDTAKQCQGKVSQLHSEWALKKRYVTVAWDVMRHVQMTGTNSLAQIKCPTDPPQVAAFVDAVKAVNLAVEARKGHKKSHVPESGLEYNHEVAEMHRRHATSELIQHIRTYDRDVRILRREFDNAMCELVTSTSAAKKNTAELRTARSILRSYLRLRDNGLWGQNRLALDIEHAKLTVQKHRTELTDTKSQHDQLQNDIAYIREIATAKESEDAAIKVVSDLKQKLIATDLELGVCNAELQKTREQLNNNDNELDTMVYTVQDLRQQLEDSIENEDEYKRLLSICELELEATKKELVRKDTEILETMERHNEKYQALAQTSKCHQANFQMTRDRMMELQGEAAGLRIQIWKCDETLANCQSHLKEKGQELESVRTYTESLERLLGSTEKKFEAKIQAEKLARDHAQAQLKVRDEELTACRSDVQKKEKRISILKKEKLEVIEKMGADLEYAYERKNEWKKMALDFKAKYFCECDLVEQQKALVMQQSALVEKEKGRGRVQDRAMNEYKAQTETRLRNLRSELMEARRVVRNARVQLGAFV